MKLKALLMAMIAVSPLASAELSFDEGYALQSIPGAPNSAAFGRFVNEGDDDIRLVSATSAVSNRTELHAHSMVDGVMKMREVPEVVVPAGESVMLERGGLHVMFLGVSRPLAPGEQAEFSVLDDNGNSYAFEVPVKAFKRQGNSHSHKGNKH